MSFELTDLQGELIFKQLVELQKGNNNLIINLKQHSNITPGIYFLKLLEWMITMQNDSDEISIYSLISFK